MAAQYPNDGAIVVAGLVQTGLALSKLHLFKDGLIPTQNTTKAEFDAAEADYDGYTPTGETVTAFLDPLVLAGGGAEIESGTTQFAYVDGMTHVTNIVKGWYLTDATDNIIAYDVFPQVVPFQNNGNGINLDVVLSYGEP